MPGQTSGSQCCGRSPCRGFNGGPSNCPAKLPRLNPDTRTPSWLQWRAEQLPGQTRRGPFQGVGHTPASMEGRAIARPNHTRPLRSRLSSRLQWRAEQLPGQTSACHPTFAVDLSLQWRAEQLPGQTKLKRLEHLANKIASMEGRAIARPNVRRGDRRAPCVCWLQWRAEQLPGQTRGCPQVRGMVPPRFNGGPSNCPAKQERHTFKLALVADASMEGRAIARPNHHIAADGAPCRDASMEGRAIARPNAMLPMSTCPAVKKLQWRAEQLPGQTGTASTPRSGSSPSFNGGPSNCPAKPQTT